MKLSAPKGITFVIAVIIAVVGLLAKIMPIAALEPYAFWIVFVAFVLLALATMLKNL